MALAFSPLQKRALGVACCGPVARGERSLVGSSRSRWSGGCRIRCCSLRSVVGSSRVGVGCFSGSNWGNQLGNELRGSAIAQQQPPSVRPANPSTRCQGQSTSCAGEFEGVQRAAAPRQESHEHWESPTQTKLSSAGIKMASTSGFLASLFSWGNECKKLCTKTQAFRRNSLAGLLCSCALVTPGLASPVTAVESLPALDFVAAAITLGGALGILQFFDELAKRDVLDKKLSRKLVHILSGLVFMLFWPLFSSSPLAKYMAAFAPAANGLRMIGLGLGLWRNEALVKAMSREGSQRELLKGPLYYAITITVVTLFFWRNSPVSAVAVANLCAGDGFADIVGRRYGTHKLPYNTSKSYIGSIAFFVLASLASIGYVAYFSAFGYFAATAKLYLATLGVSLASTIVESLPLPLDDNFTVPVTAIAVGMLLLPF